MTQAHHRRDFARGPWASFARRKAFYLQRLAAPGRVLERLVGDARRVGTDLYHIPGGAGLLLRARVALEEWRPLAEDTEGEVFS